MNILFYCNEYPPYKTGGIGTVTKIIAENLAKNHSVYVVGYYPNLCDLPKESVINGVTVYRLHLSKVNHKLRNALIKISFILNLSKIIIQKELSYTENEIEKIIKNKNIDIFEITDFYSFNSCARNLCYKKFSIPTVLRIHGSSSFIAKNKNDKRYKLIYKNDYNHFKRCDYISAVSKFSLKYICDNFPNIEFRKKVVIYNPIETKFLNPTPPSNSNNILFIGKITKSKGCFSLINAFNIIAAKNFNTNLRIIGIGELENAKKLINHEIVNRVNFLGYCNRETIISEIDNCIFACIPSYFETFGMVALEIMGRQRCLIYTNRTSGPEIINNGVNGLLVNPGNIKEISEKIEYLISNPDVCEKMGENAISEVQHRFTEDIICSQIYNFYKNILIESKLCDKYL